MRGGRGRHFTNVNELAETSASDARAGIAAALTGHVVAVSGASPG
jgi:hypothetical protein